MGRGGLHRLRRKLSGALLRIGNPRPPVRSREQRSTFAICPDRRELGVVGGRRDAETTDVAVVRGLVQGSDVITAISPQQFDAELSAGAVATLGLRLPATSRVIGITRRNDGHPSPAATLLMDEIRAICRAFRQSGRVNRG